MTISPTPGCHVSVRVFLSAAASSILPVADRRIREEGNAGLPRFPTLHVVLVLKVYAWPCQARWRATLAPVLRGAAVRSAAIPELPVPIDGRNRSQVL